MPQLQTSVRFKKTYRRLPTEIQAKVKKALRLLAEDPRHPSLQTKPIQGAPGLYEARVDLYYRLTYERLAADTLLLRTVSGHDDALRNP